MGFGIFGKLPQKRDFIALNLPRAVLEPFETWLQSAVAASRNELGQAWQDIYLVSPIWRFWIGSDILTTACAGALMPSVDSVGRFFPLSILYLAEPGQTIIPPAFDPQDVWYFMLEERLLSVLDPKAEIAVERLTEGLLPPESGVLPPAPLPVRVKRGSVWRSEGGAASEVLSVMMTADYWDTTAGRSFWWTNGGAASGPLIYARNALPDPLFYVDMLKGSVE
ncbi:type VI secretion system-associated protein TagF [Mesorhizobium sp. BAC0120]|uniref:type VI secretion system-associated protein TagF n=1 Tax=Mesorhizobium sp. BAC0120 TaxID=3090670 RepID=UPI00298BCC79|nr:type VI secretion system-associated protein TagF [Mesorhizobium sp. BAC0120]MDW6026576.1 type VI secretion system-associated protein TagF [Mesorhizobium sp. BAC0120]